MNEQRFLVDGMLVRLGKYLRCAGYDTTWDVALPSRLAAQRAELEQRIFVTRNSRIGVEFSPPPQSVSVESEDPVAQFSAVARIRALDLREQLFTRCIRCNVALESVAIRDDIRERVPPAVFERHQRFWTCASCTTVFWHGSHVENTCRKLGWALPPGD
jgi:uncharacterized protein with PIN domain